MTTNSGRPTIRTVPTDRAKPVSLGDVGSQQLLLGESGATASPMLMGVTLIRPGRTSPLIEHDTAEVAYVLSGSGRMVTDTSEHPFVAGDAILIEARCWHAIRAGDGPVRMLYVFPTPTVPPTRRHHSQLL